ncbi:MAG: hypothetical protein ACRCZ3_11790 [Providencia rustigianii]|uniref:hypothetical protein n=1 Tax=Providencia rustigianii TaxID=158850 RepID=UPI003F2B056B
MKFNELTDEVKFIAATALADILKNSHPTKEAAIESANAIKAAFIELFNKGDISIHVGNISMNPKETIEDVMAKFPPDQLSIFHIVKIANEVNLTIRKELSPYNNSGIDINAIARTILKTALTALDS